MLLPVKQLSFTMLCPIILRTKLLVAMGTMSGWFSRLGNWKERLYSVWTELCLIMQNLIPLKYDTFLLIGIAFPSVFSTASSQQPLNLLRVITGCFDS